MNPAAIEFRVAVTVDDLDKMAAFYRDGLHLPVLMQWESPGGRGVVLQFERATLELVDATQAETIDRIEAGRRVSGQIRFAFEVHDVEQAAATLVRYGAKPVSQSVVTPWGDYNQRLEAPDGMQLTLFQTSTASG